MLAEKQSVRYDIASATYGQSKRFFFNQDFRVSDFTLRRAVPVVARGLRLPARQTCARVLFSAGRGSPRA
jgi:hypothetical protein